MIPNIVVAENSEPEDVEEEIEDEDVLESGIDKNLGADLSVTTKSPTTSPLGSPAGLSSPCGSQEPNELPMPKTPVKDGLPIADGTLFSAESPERCPIVPKRPRIESPSSTVPSSSANTQNDEFAKPVETLVKLRLPPIPAGSPRCGPIVPKRPRIESPSSTVPSSSANAQIGQSQPAGGPSPMASSIPDGFAKLNETPVNAGLPFPKGSPDRGPTVPKRARIAVESKSITETWSAILRKGQSQPVGFSSPIGSTVPAGSSNPMTAVPQTPELIYFSARWTEAYARIARVSSLMGAGFRAGYLFATRYAEIQSQLAQASLLMRGSLPDDLKPPIPAAGMSIPGGLHQGQSQLATFAASIQSSVPAGSPKKNKDQIALGPRIPVSAISCSAGSQKDLSQLATTDTSMESSVPSGQKQVDGLFTAVGSLNDDGKSFPASPSNPNKLSPFPVSAKYSFFKDFKQTVEEIKEADRRMRRSVPNGSKKPKGYSVAFEPPIPAWLRDRLSQLDIVATIESPVPATPEQVNGIVNAVESPITVESSSPTASSDQNGFSMAVRSLTRTEDTVGYTVGNGNPAASSDQNGLSAAVELPHRTETSLPAGSLEDGSEKSNGNPVALGPFIPATKKSFSAGSRKRPAQQITSESAEPHKLPLTVKTGILAGASIAANLPNAGSTEPNKLPTTFGSKFPSFQAFWENVQSSDWKQVQSCLTQISSMVAFLANGEPVQLGSLLPDGSLSTVDSQPSPGSVAGPPPKASSAPLPEPQAEENGSESKDVEITTFRIVSVYSHPVNLKPGGGAHPFFDIFRRDNVRQALPRFGANSVLMMPNIVVDENLKPEDVEEEMEDEDALESDDDENLGANLSVTTKSPTPSPLGSPARRSSSCRFQEVTEVPMPTGSPIQPKTPVPAGLPETRFQITDVSLPMSSFVPTECIESNGTAVKFGSPIPDGTLFSAESSECGPIVPKRPRIAIESPSAIGQSEAAASSNGPPVPARHIEPKLTPVKVGLLIPAGSPKCGPIVPK
ncbi:hypothetical protein L5515_016441 [Caenorhabditis briggsae]|uniref:Uncharacterized protein n=1 Tax=Caenorhabditis briggsae TaxID=6238 RepID=A0AAE9FCU3_CAEBR|nr:hypothetical protein L5515_016441 [Caenorhabditis briggsae]